MKDQNPLISPVLDEQALQRVRSLNAPEHGPKLGLYRDSPRRRAMRDLLEASAATGSTVTVEFFKKDFSPRVLHCHVCPGEDRTLRYVTVRDVELDAYRRVCLDHVVRLTVNSLD